MIASLRRAATTAVTAIAAVASLVVLAPPAAHAIEADPPPGPPRCASPAPTITSASESTLNLEFRTCADDPEHPRPDLYRVRASGPAGFATFVVDGPGADERAIAALSGLTGGKAVTVTVTPSNGYGDTIGPVEGVTTILPFTSVDAFVRQQERDLRVPLTDAERADLVQHIADGDTDPALVVSTMFWTGGVPDLVAPPVRLYRAYFERDPDSAGLRYWVDQRAKGERIASMSEHFARSSEFQRRYGKLSNREFVKLVYRNVLGRAGDPAGIDYWTGRLNGGRTGRGTVMVQFSESGEFHRRSNPIVRPIVVTFALLGRRTSGGERELWAYEPDPYLELPTLVMGTAEYAARVSGS